jgi:rfaE bifunctional protein nucleotidyltransferase chain/domain
MRTAESKLVPFDRLEALGETLRRQGKRIVTTNGCFDILHWGHLKYLEEARALGDVLVCGVNADASVRGLNGAGRPITPESLRALQLAALESIDHVAIFTEATPERFLECVRPAIHVKGGDYEGKEIPERAVMKRLGGKVVCVPVVPGLSTTALLEKLKTR